MKAVILKKYAKKGGLTLGLGLFMLLTNNLSADDIYEAENAALNGVKIGSYNAGFSGKGFVDYIHADGDYIDWTVKVPRTGYYELEFQYALASGNRPLSITINGGKGKKVDFSESGSWTTWQRSKTITVKLPAGVNHIRATAVGMSGGNLDYLAIRKAADPNANDTIAPDGTQVASITLSNRQLSFSVNKANRKQIILSYQLGGKENQAVTLLPELKGATGSSVKYSVVKGKPGSQSGLLLITNGSKHGSLQFRLDKRSTYLKLYKMNGIGKLQIKIHSSALVIPEENGEDLVIYPNAWHQRRLFIPGDNHLAVNMIDNGQAMISCIWNNSAMRPIEYKSANGKTFAGIELRPRNNDILWLGIDAAPQIWVQPQEKITRRPIKLSWKPPFPAKWFVTLKKRQSDIAAENGHFDSWALADLNVEKPSAHTPGITIVNRDGRTFSAEIGMYTYPFFKKGDNIYLFYPEFRQPENCYDKSFTPLIYPLQADAATPKARVLPYNALEKLLPEQTLELLHTVTAAADRHRPTCGRTAQIEKLFYRDESKTKQKELIFFCKDMNKFIASNRLRVDDYRNWAKKSIKKLRNYAAAHPDSKGLINSLIKDLDAPETAFNQVKETIKTPEYFQTLTDKIIKLSDAKSDSESKEKQCKKICRAIRVIGGRQDHLLGKLRTIVKALRIRVTMLILQGQPADLQKLLQQLRHSTAVIMHTRLKMEGK